MRVSRWPGGDFELEPGDMVRISHPGDADGVWAEVEVGGIEEEKTPSWIPAGPKAVAMYLGEADEAPPEERAEHPTAQVLHDGRILNVRAMYLQPER